MSDRTCSVGDCGRAVLARSYCSLHYGRWRKTGDPGPAEMLKPYGKRTPGASCSVVGCPRDVLVASRGMCQAHYKRWQRHGDTGEADIRPAWDGSVDYRLMHDWVQKRRGRASNFTCARCGNPAHEWAYDHADEAELVMPLDAPQHAGFAYSLDMGHYEPLCRPCHRKADLNRDKATT